MTRQAKPEFDPNKDYAKKCSYGKSPVFEQDNALFDAGYKFISKTSDAKKKERAAKKKVMQKSIQEKLSGNLDGFKTPDRPSGIQQAYDENRAAKAAEDNVE
jgi:hypothetical protein